MLFASAIERPRSDSSHVLSSMAHSLIPNGHNSQVPFGKFTFWAYLGDHQVVYTIDETRRLRLEMLISQHGGKLANLNEALGYERNHTQLARIRNKNKRSDRPGQFFVMGDVQAREIEEKLKLAVGWMDTPPSASNAVPHKVESPVSPYTVTRDYDQYTNAAIEVMLALKEYQREGALAALRTHVQNLSPPRDGQTLSMAA